MEQIMPMFLRKFLHKLYIKFISVMVVFAPSSMPQQTFAGEGSARQLCRHIARLGAKKILVVTDKPLRELGVVDQAVAGLVEAGVELAWYDGVLPDPTYDQVAEGVAVAREHGCQVVLAVGGGSAMDAAKIICASVTSADNPQDWVGFGKVKHEILDFYAIPTTSGTGSEATSGAVISDSTTHEKGVISGPALLPLAIALDPTLISGLPPHITAATGMDALTHAIEAYIGVWERGNRKEVASIATHLIFENLATACRDGGNMQAREGMAMGAYYAGLAINQVNVGNVHAIAHQLGGKYGIPHGLANALVLPHVLDFCRAEAQESLAELAVLIGVAQDGDAAGPAAAKFIQAVRDLRAEVGIGETSDLIKREDFDYLTGNAISEGALYPVPRLLDRDSVHDILGRIAA
jgi:alcohol dehydrogenase class IV